MNRTYSSIELGQIGAPAQRIFNFFRRRQDAFQQWRKRGKLRAALHGLSDRELADIGTTFGEIEYVVLTPPVEPRGIRAERSSLA